VGPGGTGGTGAAGGMGGTGGVEVGGMGGTGGMGGGGPVVIHQFTAGVPGGSPTGYTFTDNWLVIECPTDNRTSQLSEKDVRPFGANAARPRNVGAGWGLSVESERTNVIPYSEAWTGAGWTGAGLPMDIVATTDGNPTGAMAPVTKFVNNTAERQSNYVFNVPMGYGTTWAKGAGGAGPNFAYFVVGNTALANWKYAVVDDATTWKRYEVASAEGDFLLQTLYDTIDMNPPLISATESAGVYGYGAQHEPDALYPSSFIPTQADERTRAADKLYSSLPSKLIAGGHFHVKLVFAPNYASNEASAARHDLVYMDENNRVTMLLAPEGGTLLLKTGGKELKASAPATWSREQALTIEASSTSTIRELSLSGATTGFFAISDMQIETSPTNKNVHILGNTSGAQECADLRSVVFYEAN